MTKNQAQSLRDWTFRIGGLVWGFFALGGFALLCYECLHRLESGQWDIHQAKNVFLSIGIDPEQLTWVGLRGIAMWLTELPLFLWMVFAPVFLFATVSFLVEEFIENVRSATDGEIGVS